MTDYKEISALRTAIISFYGFGVVDRIFAIRKVGTSDHRFMGDKNPFAPRTKPVCRTIEFYFSAGFSDQSGDFVYEAGRFVSVG